MKPWHCRPYQGQAGKKHPVMQREIHMALKGRVRTSGAREGRARSQASKVALHHLLGFLHLEIARDGQAGVGRDVEPLEEGLSIVHGSRVQVFMEPDGRPVIGVR